MVTACYLDSHEDPGEADSNAGDADDIADIEIDYSEENAE